MRRREDRWSRISRQGKRIVGWLIALLVIVLAMTVVFLGTPYEPPPESVSAVEDDDRVTLEQTNGGYVLEPATTEAEAGLVFYPGARVEPSAYLESLAPLARDANVTIIVPRMPLNLAVTDYAIARTGLRTDAATSAMDDYEELDRWYVGGHSMGGAMACRYARHNPDRLDGLLLYASYCDQDISETGLAVLSVAGAADTVITRETYERNLANLPANASIHELPGLNHTQFGSYRAQLGDEPSGTSYEAAHDRLNDVVLSWLDTHSSG